MTISANSTRTVVTLPAGTTSTTFTFDYLNASNIKVAFNNIPKILGADYTISNKTITFTVPLVAETLVSIISGELYGRSYDFLNPEQFSARSVNYQLDSLALQLIQIRDKALLVGEYDKSIELSELIRLINDAVVSTKTSADKAKSYELLAQDWAEKDTDVTDGHKSAKTWAEAASQIVIPDGSITGNKLATPFNKKFYSTVKNSSYTDINYSQMSSTDALVNGLMVSKSESAYLESPTKHSRQGVVHNWYSDGINVYPEYITYFVNHDSKGGRMSYYRERDKNVMSFSLVNTVNDAPEVGIKIKEGYRPQIDAMSYSAIKNFTQTDLGYVAAGDIVTVVNGHDAVLMAIRMPDGTYTCSLTDIITIPIMSNEPNIIVTYDTQQFGLFHILKGKGSASIELTSAIYVGAYLARCYVDTEQIKIRVDRYSASKPTENITVSFSITFIATTLVQ